MATGIYTHKSTQGFQKEHKDFVPSKSRKKAGRKMRGQKRKSNNFNPWNKGKKMPLKYRQKLSIIHLNSKKHKRGKEAYNWKETEYSYRVLHRWVERWKGKPINCEMCGTKEKRKYHWANIDHKYRRILDDYISLCVPCHKKYDTKINNN